MLSLKQNKPSPNKLVGKYLANELRAFVEEISFPRVFGTNDNFKAREIVEKELTKICGEKPKLLGDTKSVVIGNPETARFIVGAHYDSVPNTPGADDNASAVAVMCQVAANVQKDICFVSFNGEECGLLGSTEFVKKFIPKKNKLEQVHILEMVGFRTTEPNSQKNPVGNLINDIPTVGDFIGAVSLHTMLMSFIMGKANESDIKVVGLGIPSMMGASLIAIKKFAPHLLRSDHAPFWDAGLPAVMWTDTAEFRNNNYHELTDTPDTLDYDFMSSVGLLISNVVKV